MAATATPTHDTRRDHTFETIAGHALPKALLRYMIESDRLPHALLLHGPAGVGKTSFAWALAKEILWSGLRGAKTGPEGEERRRRLVSRVSREDIHPDVFSLAPSGPARVIRVDEIRTFMDEHAHIVPVEGAYKVLLIEGAEAINESAANSMLKLLEEPPPFLRFLLVTDAPHRLLDTIRSRCAPVRFQPLDEEELSAWLRDSEGAAEGERLRAAVHWSEGRPARAQLYLKQGAEAEGRVARAMEDFHAIGFPSIFLVGERLAGISPEPGDALLALLVYFRDLLLHGLGEGSHALEAAAGHAFEAHAAKLGPAAVMAAIDEILAEMASGRGMIGREVQLEALLCRIGKAMRAAA